ASACAQTRDTAAIFGTVTDAQGAAIPGAPVTVTNANTGQAQKVTTDESGGYVFNLLPVGSYTITVEQPAFRRYQRTGVLLQANENVKVDVTLELGDVKTTVSVDAAASQVEVRASTLKETVDRMRVVELPLNGRNAADLALLAPGVVPHGSNTGDEGGNIRPRGQKSLTINGSRNNNVRYTMDGGENMDNLFNSNLVFPFPDALQEFSVETSNMSMVHGNNSAGAVNVVTKSGTNDFHGSAFWFVRNTELNATGFFSHTKDQLKRNQTGFTLGGPLKKNKLFAFGGFQQLWIRSASGGSRSQTLTATERRGDFSSNSIVINDPVTGRPFPNNTIPTSRLNQASLKLLTVSPLPDPDGFTRYVFAFPENGQQYIGRLDYVHSAKHNFVFRAFQNNQTNPFHSNPDNIHSSRTEGFQDSINATLSHNYVLSPTLIAHSQITGMHLVSKALSDFPKSIRDFGVNVYAASNDIDVALTNSGVGFSAPPKVDFRRATEEVVHDWIWTKGSHTFTWGVQLNWRQYNEDTIYRSSGAYRFDGHATGSGARAGFDRADFMLGELSFFTQNNGELENRRQFTKGLYFGDTWRATRRLTLNFGIRYEPYSFFSDTMDRNQTFDLGNYQKGVRSKIFRNAPPGLLYRGDAKPSGGTVGKEVAEPDWNNLAPRLGIAWDPFGDGKSSIRAGYGIYYDAPSLFTANNANNVAPWSYSVLFDDGVFDNPYRGRERLNVYPLTSFGADSPFTDPLETIVLDGKYVTAYTQNWNLTVEREVFHDTRLRVAYVGSAASHLKGEYDQNPPIYNPNRTLAQNRATIDERRPIKGFQRIDRFFHGLNSNYHSLQVSVDKRYGGGFTILNSYTWSKSLDYQSVNQAAQDAPLSYPFNFFHGRGPSNQHRPHRLVNSFVWDIPAPSQAAPALKAVVGDWKLSGIVTLQSGRAFSIGATGDPLAGISGARVDLVGSGYPVLDTGRSKGVKIAAYFDKNRFQNPAPNTLGTLGRNRLEGPGFANVDVSLVKGFRLLFMGEAGLGQFRFEAFNLFNRTNFSNPVTGITNPNFGRLTGTDGAPRILQLAIKLAF
ncbi:MAG: carboxypeptidase regulatory-like domain-containing protein, partial [Acidobacteriota bacterium]